MPEDLFDLIAEKTAAFHERMDVGVAEAKSKQRAGEFVLESVTPGHSDLSPVSTSGQSRNGCFTTTIDWS